MASLNPISILITAKDEASAVIKATAANVEAMSAEMNAAGVTVSGLGRGLVDVGSTLTKDVTLPIIAVGAASTKMAFDFAQKMELLHTSAGIPQGAIQGLSNTVLQLAGQVGQAPDKLAEGLYHVASAGNGIWSTSQQLDILKVAAEGANLGMADLDDTTYALTSAMASGVKGAKDASDMMAVLTAIVGAGDMKMQDLNGALSTGILSTAASFGISVQSVGAALATLTDNGERADEAATRLRMSLSLMSSPSHQAATQLEALGLTAEDASKATSSMNKVFAQSGLTTTKLADDLRQPNGITVAIQDLKKHLEDAGLSASETDAMLAKAFGGGRTDAALLTMLQNTDRLDSKYQAITQDAGQFQNKLTDLENTPQFKIKQAWDSMQASLITIGSDLLPIAAKGLDFVATKVEELGTWWSKLDPTQKAVIEQLMFAFAIGGPLMVGAGKFVGLISDIHTGFSLLGGIVRPVMGLLDFAPAAEGAVGATEAIAGGGGLAAALGSVGLIAGGAALAFGAGFMAMNALMKTSEDTSESLNDKVNPSVKRYKDLAADLGVTLKGTSSNVSMLGLAQLTVKNDTDLVSAATRQVNSLQQNHTAIAKDLASKQTDVANAQKSVNDNLSKFGQNSPQYQSAVDNLKQKQINYNLALNDSIGKNLDLQIKTGELSGAEKTLQGDTSYLTSLQSFLNNKLSDGKGIVATWGPTALAQIPAIQTLQSAIATVAASWKSTVDTINLQSANVGKVIQGIGSDISYVQGQSDILNNKLGAAKNSAILLQNAGGSLQGGASTGVPGVKQAHALGTNFAPGGWSMVGENGPELVNMPTGSKVLNTKDTKNQLNNGSPTVNVTQHIYTQMDYNKGIQNIGFLLRRRTG